MSRCHFGCDNIDFFSTPGSFSPRWAGEYIFFQEILQKAFKWSLPLNPIFKTYFGDFRNAKTLLWSRGIYFRTRKWLRFQGNFPEVFFWCKQICIVLQFCQKQMNLTITNISRVETHNPIGGYRVMFVQYFSARVVDLLSTIFFPILGPFCGEHSGDNWHCENIPQI